MSNTLLTPSLQDQVHQFFQIRFVEDMTSVDLLCAEVFIQPSSMGIAKQSQSERLDKKPRKKQARNYNSSIHSIHCDNCKEKELCLKLVKK